MRRAPAPRRRSGSATPISPRQANFDGSPDGSGPSEVNRQKTMPVGSFPANAFGLHDMHGNVYAMGGGLLARRLHRDGADRRLGLAGGRLHAVMSARRVVGRLAKSSCVRLPAPGSYKDELFSTDGLRIARSL